MALPEHEKFWDTILEHLRSVGSDSISGIARAVSVGRPKPIHRLTVAGYLAAMTEVGILREVARPPSKHYRVANPHSHRTLYDRVAAAARAVGGDEWPLVAVAALCQVLGRPVFRAELHHAGIPVSAELIQVEVNDATRRTIRALLGRRPKTGVEVPPRDPLLHAPEIRGVSMVLRRALLSATEATALAAEEERGAQTALWETA